MALDGQGPMSPAQPAGLAYVGDHDPGLHRVPSATGFDYLDDAGAPVNDPKTLDRIRDLPLARGAGRAGEVADVNEPRINADERR